MRKSRAFSLAELLVALVLFVVAILGVIALSISILKTERKATDLGEGKLVAQTLMSQLLEAARTDTPSGSRAAFLAQNQPATAYQSGNLQVHRTSYQYQIYVTTVSDTSGNPIGAGLTSNRLKNVEIQVSWWNAANQNRAGYGALKTSLSQLVSEGEI